MQNAKEELITLMSEEPLSSFYYILCAKIWSGTTYDYDEKNEEASPLIVTEGKDIAMLKLNHSPEDQVNFLEDLNIDYDDGYGTQFLFGTVWLKHKFNDKAIWLTRWEYDGSEGWEIHKSPEFYKELI